MSSRVLIYEADFASFFEQLNRKDQQYFYDTLVLINSLGLDEKLVPHLIEIPDSKGLMDLKVYCESGIGGMICFNGYDGKLIITIGYLTETHDIPINSVKRAEVLREQYFLNE